MLKTKYYTDLEIPIYNFFKIIDKSDYSYLIKKKGLTKGKPDQIWEELFADYLTKSGNTKSAGMLTLMKRYYGLQSRISVVNEVISSLRQKHNENLVKVMRQMGFRYKYNPFSPSYQKELNLTISRAKTWIIELDKTGKQLDKAIKSSENTVKSDIENTLVGLGSFLNRRIDPKTETMAEYIEIVKLYESEIKHGQRRQNK